MDKRDLALAAALTSMSLRERWREPGGTGARELISLSDEEDEEEDEEELIN